MTRTTGTSDVDLLVDADLPSFVGDLHAGTMRWDLIHPFPEQDSDDREVGSASVAKVATLLRERLDPIAVDTTRQLPDGLLDDLRRGGFLRLGVPPELGGHGLSPYNVFRVLAAAVSWSTSVGPVLTADNGLGVAAYLPALPAGPLRDWVRERVAAGVVSCTADTEPTGAANTRRMTTAVPTDDGAAFEITGEKIYVANASVADVIVTTATVPEPDGDQLRLFFVDARDPGIHVRARHDFIGMAGFPNGNLRYDRVRVPRERMLVESRHEGRLTPAVTRMVVRGRMYHVVAPSLAFSRMALHCVRDFARRRSIDGRPLGSYQEVQRQVAESLADTFAIEAIAEWCLLADRDRPVNPLYEQLSAKNIASLTCWRVMDRAMALLAGEGLETAASKVRRGARPLPLERVYRDARIMRITGGVDFQLHNWAGRYLLTHHDASTDGRRPALAALPDVALSARNKAHARRVDADAERLARTCREIVARWPDQAVLYERERLVILLSHLVDELLTMSLVLARACRLTARGRAETQDLADVYCTAAGHRLDDRWRRLTAEIEQEVPDAARVAGDWLSGDRLDFLVDDLIPPSMGPDR